jgi:hypothetical protein
LKLIGKAFFLNAKELAKGRKAQKIFPNLGDNVFLISILP